jgi:hypothetical protein
VARGPRGTEAGAAATAAGRGSVKSRQPGRSAWGGPVTGRDSVVCPRQGNHLDQVADFVLGKLRATSAWLTIPTRS